MPEPHTNARLEAFCDGVFAIAITLLVLDIKIPHSEQHTSAAELWTSLRQIAPSIGTFLLSFVIILISWVNHHGAMKLIDRSSVPFMYANGFLLLTVVFLPFPTQLLGDTIMTDAAAPAVIIFEVVLALQAVGWILFSTSAFKNNLVKKGSAAARLRANMKFGYYALVTYSFFAIIAFWFPVAIAIITTIIWIFWLIFGMKMKEE